ncbi:flagellin [Anaerotruncus sp. 1XD22-93]|nr:flagellin [Anaerotruncus sp. 1XD42-93]NBK20087.1 flagellin [Anaerotruncus sp. 1XD42-93]RKJ87188.1 flagellin [Anaerotruncus sp. 1XD22-93]
MVVRSNIMAVNAQRQLGVNNNQVSKALEKLSSGYRINRAGDDASGLAISEKMKAQIKGLDTASLNAQDGISVVQTAEGALTEVHNMLNRMVELATRSANGINADLNRDALQNEVSALQEEIDRIAQATTFNDIHLLDGTGGSGGTGGTSVEPAEVTQPTTPTTTATDGAAGTAATIKLDVAGFTATKPGKVDIKLGDKVIGEVEVTEGMTDAEFADAVAGLTFNINDGTTDHAFTGAVDTAGGTAITFTQTTPAVLDLTNAKVDGYMSGDDISIEPQEPAAGAAKAAAADAPEKPDFSGANALTFDDADGNGASADASGLDADAIQAALDAAAAADPTVTGGNITIELNQAGDGYELKAGNVVLGSTGNAANNSIVGADNAGTDKALVFTTADGTALGKVVVSATTATALTGEMDAPLDTGVEATAAGADNNGAAGGAGSTFILQIGDTAAQYNQLTFTIGNMTSQGIGVDTVDISTLKGAQNAINTVKTAIDTVSTQRAELGAIQNRLEYTINNLDTSSENIQAANSRIRDTDMAKMMMEYTKVNVVTQSAQAMLAQANQQPQSVLQLLQ